MELRNKLDWTRSQSQREVKRIQAEANKLRVKWMMVAGSDATLNSLGITRGGGGGPFIWRLEKAGIDHHRCRASMIAARAKRGQTRSPAIHCHRCGTRSHQRRTFLSYLHRRRKDVAEDEVTGADDPWNSNKLSGLQKDLRRSM